MVYYRLGQGKNYDIWRKSRHKYIVRKENDKIKSIEKMLNKGIKTSNIAKKHGYKSVKGLYDFLYKYGLGVRQLQKYNTR